MSTKRYCDNCEQEMQHVGGSGLVFFGGEDGYRWNMRFSLHKSDEVRERDLCRDCAVHLLVEGAAKAKKTLEILKWLATTKGVDE